MRSPVTLALAASFGVLTTLPVIAQDAAKATDVVATVGDQDITLGHMIMMGQTMGPRLQSLPPEQQADAILDQLIEIVSVAQSIEGDLNPAQELNLENERWLSLARTALSAVAEQAVSEDAIKAAYDAATAGMEPEQEYNAAHILVETEDAAKAIREELLGGADFAALAKEKSTGPSGPSGGDLGWFGAGMMVKPFEDAVLALEAGDISEPVQTQFGWHVIKLNETRAKPTPTLDEMRAGLAETLQRDAVNAALEKISGDAKVVRTETTIDPASLRNIELVNPAAE